MIDAGTKSTLFLHVLGRNEQTALYRLPLVLCLMGMGNVCIVMRHGPLATSISYRIVPNHRSIEECTIFYWLCF